MPQNDYTINTAPTGVVLQDIWVLAYTNRDLSYIPQFRHIYKLTDITLKQQSSLFTESPGPTALEFGSFLTYAKVPIQIYYSDDVLLASNGNYIAIFNIDTLYNLYRFKDVINYDGTQGIAYNPNNNLLYAVRSNGNYASTIRPSIIVAVDLLTQTETPVNITGVDFSYLTGINFDAAYNLYVADYTNNSVAKIVFTDNYSGIGTIIVNNFGGINRPIGVTNDAQYNTYVSNSFSNNVVKITNTGYISIIASDLDTPTQLQYNFANNSIYVANLGKNTTPYICSISNNIVTNVYSHPNPPFDIEYYFYGLAVTPQGAVYFSAYSDNQQVSANDSFIGILTPDNVGINVAGTFSYTFSGNTQYLSIAPITSVALNYQQNALYATGYSAPWNPNFIPYYPYPYGLIWKISLSDPSYTPVIFYPPNMSSIDPNAPYMNNPTCIALDSSYNLYVGNSVDSKIIVIDTSANAAYLDITGVVTNGPTGLTFDASYNLYFANYVSNTICKLTFPIDSLHATGTTLPITGSIISEPTSLAIDNANNILYIANTGFNNILSVNLSTYVATIYATIPTGTKNPPGLVYDSLRGLLYVTNQNTNQIGVIANQQGPVDVNFTDVDLLLLPQGIMMDISNNILYVANYGSSANPIVQVTLDINSNTLYNSYFDSLTSAVSMAITYADEEGGAFVGCRTELSYVPVIGSADTIAGFIGVQYQYANSGNGFADAWLTFACALIDIYGYSSYFIQPYYVYYGSVSTDNYSTIRLRGIIPADLDVPFNIDCNTIRQEIIVTGDTPNYNNINISLVFGNTSSTGPFYLYVADTSDQCITQVVITAPNYFSGVGTKLNIDFASINFYPGQMTIYNSTMYCLDASANISGIRVCKIDLSAINPLPAVPYIPTIIANIPSITIATGITHDTSGYLYIAGESIYRLTPDPSYILGIVVPNNVVATSELAYNKCIIYNKTGNIINSVCTPPFNSSRSYFEEISLSFNPFICIKLFGGEIGTYNNTLYMGDVVSSTSLPIIDFSFNVYQNYIIIDPVVIPPDTPTNTSFYFITPSVIPNPSNTYYLQCGSTKIADAFCNNCTYNNTIFLSGTYPTGLVYSDFSKYLYVALQNNTISRINSVGLVQNDYISTRIGLQGPTSVVLDISFNMYVLNVTGGFITKLTLANEIISADNTFYTNINTPICLTYDYITNKYLYLLSGNVPTMVITRIDITNPANFIYLPIPFGSLYDSNGLVIGAPTIYEEYLYVSNTDQFGNNSIKKITLLDQIDLTNNVYNIQTEIVLYSGNPYKPYTLDYIGQYLYVSNKNLPSSITKIRVANQALGIPASATQPWVVNGISVPNGLTHDISGNLYVANAGTGPRNSRISKIYIDYFPFNNVVLADGTCANAQIYDFTTNSYVNINYNPTNPTIFPIPFPIPLQPYPIQG